MPADAGKIAFVTGAGGGLGSACCAALAARGMEVVAADLDLAAAERVAGRALQLDVTSREAVEAVVAHIGRIDVLVNLAGVLRSATLENIDDGDFALTMATHLDGTLNTMRAVAPRMRETGYGRIVNTSSIGARGMIGGGAYGAAKSAIEGLTRAAAVELAKYGVTANCVAPGLIEAGMFLTIPEGHRATQIAKIPAGRTGDPAEVAACVAFLASAEASYVTGQTLLVCGGLSLGY